MKKMCVIFLIVISTFVSLFSQEKQDIPGINKKDLPEAKFLPERSYSGDMLFSYMNGGADLYLEYGFTELTVSEFGYKKGKFKMEVFKMNDPESAFGIFSISKFHCRYKPVFSTYTCQTKYQLLICSGQYYISIINESGNKTDSASSILIGEKVVSKISQKSVDLSPLLPGVPPETLRNDAKLVKGRLGLANGFDELSDYFKDATGYTALIVPLKEKTLVLIRFENYEDLQKFAELHNWIQSNLSDSGYKMEKGEFVKKLNGNYIYIEIQKNSQIN